LPTTAGNSGTFSPQIFGTGFRNGTAVTLSCAGATFQATGVSINRGTATPTFNLTGATPGSCDVLVNNPDGSSATLATSVIIEQGGVAQVWVDVVGRNVLRAGTNQVYYVEYGNHGIVDAPMTRIWVAFPSYIQWKAAIQGPSSSGQQNGTTYLAFDVAPFAGSTAEIPMFLIAPNNPIYAHQNFQLEVWAQ
jgi:hypothetical protein